MEMIDKTIFVVVGSDYSGIKKQKHPKNLGDFGFWMGSEVQWMILSQSANQTISIWFPIRHNWNFRPLLHTKQFVWKSSLDLIHFFGGFSSLSLACFTFVLLPGLSLYVSFVASLPRSLSLDPSPLSHTFSKSVLIGVLLAFVVVDGVAVVVVVVVFI